MLCSVILTVCNRRESVERALRSIMAQTHRPLEIVVVDNGSTDGSRELCAAILQTASRDERLTLRLLDQPQKGVCAARNMGLRSAAGEWVAFFDDDDEMSPDFIEKMHSAIEHAEEEKNWALTRTRMVMPDGRQQVRAGWENPTLTDHILGSFVSTQSILVRREWLIALGGWNESLPVWNDYALGVTLFCHDARPLFVKGAFHHIYQHPHGITGTNAPQKTEGILRAFLAIRRTLDAGPMSSSEAYAQARLALYRRLEIAVGQLHRDAHPEQARRLLSSARSLAPSSIRQRLFGRLLRAYAALGGRGAWRIARPGC